MFRRGILIFWGQTTLNGHNSNNDNNNDDDDFVHNVHFSFKTLKLSGLLEEIDNKRVMSLNPGNGSFFTFIYCTMQLFKTPKIIEKEDCECLTLKLFINNLLKTQFVLQDMPAY